MSATEQIRSATIRIASTDGKGKLWSGIIDDDSDHYWTHYSGSLEADPWYVITSLVELALDMGYRRILINASDDYSDRFFPEGAEAGDV